MRRPTRQVLGLAAVLVLAACGAAPVAPPATTGSGTTAPTSAPSPTPSATPSRTTAAPTSTPSPSQPSTRSPSPTTHTPTTRPPVASPTGLPAALLGEDLRVIPTSRHVVALTFDGGSNDAGLASILATLEAEGVRATFFLTGRFVALYPDDARRIAAAGHVIGNHTMTHPHGTQITDAALRAEVRDAEAMIRSTAGVAAKPWFRFPYGERTAADVDLVNDLGYGCISWTVDTLGWLGTERGTSADVTTRVLARLQPGEIVLMHVGSNPDDATTFDADALGATIQALRARGYAFTTVDTLLR